jgi:hypothetical protein
VWHEGVFGLSGKQRFFDKQGKAPRIGGLRPRIRLSVGSADNHGSLTIRSASGFHDQLSTLPHVPELKFTRRNVPNEELRRPKVWRKPTRTVTIGSA